MKVISALRQLIPVLVFVAFAIHAPAALAKSVKSAAEGGCPSVHSIGNFLQSADVSFTFGDDGTGTGTDNYFFTGVPSTDGTSPGLIEYCVYPAGQTQPVSGAADYDSWGFVVPKKASHGWFAFKRPQGNPTDIPYDGNTYQVGHASWGVDPITGGSLAPSGQTILLHVFDSDACTALYGSPTDTCFVFPILGGGGGH